MSELKVRRELKQHEKELVRSGLLKDATHEGASSIWLSAESTGDVEGMTRLYRPMGDSEIEFLVSHGVLPPTQPYQTVVEGDVGREYAEKYLTGRKSVDTSPTTVVEFVCPTDLSKRLFSMQSKIEDGAMSHGLGDKGGKGLPIFNESLESGKTTWRIVRVKRAMARKKK